LFLQKFEANPNFINYFLIHRLWREV